MKKISLKGILAIVVSAATIITIGAIPLAAYIQFQNENKVGPVTPGSDNPGDDTSDDKPSDDKPSRVVVTKIDAKLKDGIVYYANNKAAPKVDDFVVTATYSDGTTKTLKNDEDGVSISIPSGFALNGGKVNISYSGFNVTLDLKLTAVVIDSLKILTAPGKTNYVAGEEFDPYLIQVEAVYNDGSTKIIEKKTEEAGGEGYVFEGSIPKTIDSDKEESSITVSYTEGDVTKTVEQKVTVYKSLPVGKSIAFKANDVAVNEGDDLSTIKTKATADITYSYDDKNEITNTLLVSADKLNVADTAGNAVFGQNYAIDISAKDNADLKGKLNLIVHKKIEAELAKTAGKGKIGYKYPSVGAETDADGNERTLVKSFNTTGKNGEFDGADAKPLNSNYFELYVDSKNDASGELIITMSNGNYRASGGKKMMEPLQLNTVFDLTVNGQAVEISDDVVLPAVGPFDNSVANEKVYGVYVPVTFKNIDLSAGQNILNFRMKRSTIGEKTSWSESPVCNFDFIELNMAGKPFDPASVTSIEPETAIQDGISLDELKNINVVGVNKDNHKSPLSNEYYDLTLDGKALTEIDEATLPAGSYELLIKGKNGVTPEFKQEIKLSQKIEAETATNLKNVKKASGTESEWGTEDKIKFNGLTMSFGGAQGGWEHSFEIKFNVGKDKDLSLYVRMSNPAATKDANGKYHPTPVQLNKLFTLSLDGNENADLIKDSAVITGEEYVGASQYYINQAYLRFYVVKLSNLTNLSEGEHTLKVKVNNTHPDYTYPAYKGEGIGPNIDWFEMKKPNYDISKIKSLSFSQQEITTDELGYVKEFAYPQVQGTLEDGSKVVVDPEDLKYSWDKTMPEKFAPGQEYGLTATLADTEIKTSLKIKTSSYIKAKYNSKLDGEARLTNEKDAVDGKTYTFIGSTKPGSVVSFNYYVTEAGKYDLIYNFANGYVLRTDGKYYTKDLLLNDIITLTVDNKEVDISDATKFTVKGRTTPISDSTHVYHYFEDFNFGEFDFTAGAHEITMKFKATTIDQYTYWADNNGVKKKYEEKKAAYEALAEDDPNKAAAKKAMDDAKKDLDSESANLNIQYIQLNKK